MSIDIERIAAVNTLLPALLEISDKMNERDARISTLEAERDAANIKAYGLLKMSERLESALASKQRAIDTVLMLVSEPSSGREHHIASILRPEATPTDAKPQPAMSKPIAEAFDSIAQPEPSGDMAVRLVKRLATEVEFIADHVGPPAGVFRSLRAIIAECGGAK